jgi:hypothetical protein
MTELFLKIIRSGDAITQNVDQVEWTLARPAVLWVGLMLLVVIGFGIVLRHRSRLPHVGAGPRALLSTCRIGVLFLLILALSGPYVRFEETVEQKAIVALVLDESGSMTLPAGPFSAEQAPGLLRATGLAPAEEPKEGSQEKRKEAFAQLYSRLNDLSRLELVEAVLKNEQALLTELGERFELRVYRVAGSVRQAASVGDPLVPLQPSEADDTVLGSAIREVIDGAAGRTLAGILLFSDGRSTAGPDPMSVVRGAAKRGESSAVDTPVWVVPAGSTEPQPDVVLLDVVSPRQVAREDIGTIIATVSSQGFAEKDVIVELLETDKILDSKAVPLREGQRQQVQLSFRAREFGDKLLTVRVGPLPGESVSSNNSQEVVIRVDADKKKVLYLEGIPRWDFRFLDHALRRDRGLDVTIVMESQLVAAGVAPGKLPHAARLPRDAAGFAEYATVLLGDISPRLLPPRLQAELVRAVEEEGVGLFIQAGTEHMPHAFADGPLGKALPVTLTPVPRDKLATEAAVGGTEDTDVPAVRSGRGGVTAAAMDPFRMRVTAAGSFHRAFQLYDSATKNRNVWSRMPTFYWAAAVDSQRPGATVLAEVETADGLRPLIAEHLFGRGRVLFLGLDSTYRWRRNIGSHLFYRFWGQTQRHLARVDDEKGEGSWIRVNPERLEPGQDVVIEVYLEGPDCQPLEQEQIELRIVRRPNDAVEPLFIDSAGTGDGHFRGFWTATEQGVFDIITASGEVAPISAMVHVRDSRREMMHPSIALDVLGDMADWTGGGLLSLDKIGQLQDKLEGEKVEWTRTHEEEIWDNWLVLLLLVALYCTDVGLRRMMGLT